jgi:IS1 family transposase
VAYRWGKRDLKTAQKLRKRIQGLGIRYERITRDDGDSFRAAFVEDNHETGKKHTGGIAGNNCRLKYRIRRAFRKTGCFSKKRFNHWKVFEMAFFYLNYGFV